MRIRKNYELAKMDEEYIAVPLGETEECDLFQLNSTAAFLWQSILDGADTREKLLQAMMAHYEDLEKSVAEEDLDLFLETASVALED